jgi:hypothetical protein
MENLRPDPPRVGRACRSRCEATDGQLAQHFFLRVVGPADDFLKGDDEFLLVVDQATERRQFRAAGEFTDVPSVLGK